jgi:hypothetical protein
MSKPAAVLAELRGLYAEIQAAADILAQGNERLLEQQRQRGIQQRGIVFGLVETDDSRTGLWLPLPGAHTWRRLASLCCGCPTTWRS